jgi:hypothetical protein
LIVEGFDFFERYVLLLPPRGEIVCVLSFHSEDALNEQLRSYGRSGFKKKVAAAVQFRVC